MRKEVDIVVASCHWGLWQEVLQYMTDIAHAAIDAGADVVMGHGPHFSLPTELYKGKPIFYGVGSEKCGPCPRKKAVNWRRHVGWRNNVQ